MTKSPHAQGLDGAPAGVLPLKTLRPPAGASILDSDSTRAALDPHQFIDRVNELCDQLEPAWRAGVSLEPRTSALPVSAVVVLGMGGSAMGGRLLQALAVDLAACVPIVLVRDYVLPAHVGPGTFVIASSHSGETEETLTAFEQAVQSGAECVAVSTGGRLAEIARSAGLSPLIFTHEGEPRCALGWNLGLLLGLCCRIGVLPDLTADLRGAVRAMCSLRASIGVEVPEADNAAKQVARRLYCRVPVILGAQSAAPVAYRWRTQINENAKSWAISDELPEMNHNAFAGLGLPVTTLGFLHAVFLRQASVHRRNALRIEATRDEMQRCGISSEVLALPGRTALEEMLYGILFGDYVSYYLALLNDVAPAPVPALSRLKVWLAAR